ncbi:hypothetical protein [Candidatus Paracaedibacter symbiosus]|uniref:hypothetical protein n=1 Tax=Candidatus Paracaedibacter symbiosus TaxID=244582 RepID=UPI000509500A|nr:hypothetical protein [Candidatus Paracaedibacter symbiosus]
MNIAYFFKKWMFIAFTLTVIAVKTSASTIDEFAQVQYNMITKLNNYIDQEAPIDIDRLSEEAKILIQHNTLTAHDLISHILTGNKRYLLQRDYTSSLFCNPPSVQLESIAQRLLSKDSYKVQEEKLLYLIFNLFEKKEFTLRVNFLWIANTVLDVAVNDLYIQPLRKNFFARDVFKETAQQALILPKNSRSLEYAQHAISLLYYYDYVALVIDHLYNPHTPLMSFKDIYSHLASRTYQYYQELAVPLNTYELLLPDTPQSAKTFLEKGGLSLHDIQYLLVLKLSHRSKLSQLWSLKEPEVEINRDLWLSWWKKLLEVSWNQPLLMKKISEVIDEGDIQDRCDIFYSLMALPFRERVSLFQIIISSYKLKKGSSNVSILIKALLSIPISKWPELSSYISCFIFPTTDPINKSIMVNVFKNVQYKEWPEFFTACLHLTEGLRPVEQPDAMVILSHISSHNWQPFITCVKRLIPQGTNTSLKLEIIKLLSQFSREKWQIITHVPFKDERNNVINY